MRLLFLPLLLLVSSGSFAQFWHQQHFDGADTSASNSIIIDLDTASGNIWQVGKPQKVIFHKASTLPNALVTDTLNNYPVNNTSRFTFSFYFPISYGALALQWLQKLDMDHNLDGGIVEFSQDSGTTWQNAFNNINVLNFYGYQAINAGTVFTGEKAFTGQDTSWRNIWLCFKPNTFQMNTKAMFRFTLKTDSVNTNHEGWMIDNMYLNLTMLHPVNEMKMAEHLKVFPTLTNGIVRIEHPSGNDIVPVQSIELWSISGQLLERITNNLGKYKLDLAKYATGMFYLKITTNSRTENHPIMLYKD